MQRYQVLGFLTVIFLLGYNNCSEMHFASDGTAGKLTTTDQEAQDNFDDIKTTCASGTQETMTVSVNFPNPYDSGLKCEFGIGDNLSILDRFFRARREQPVNFNLPSGATLCGMDFSFPSQKIHFDDEFLFLLNDVIVASSYDFSGDFEQLLGMNVFDWQKIAGKDWTNSNARAARQTPFCEGMNSGQSSCSWPATDTTGTIRMQFKPEVFQKIFALNPTRSAQEFKLVVTGDNDTQCNKNSAGDTVNCDCTHLPIGFTATVRFVR